MFYLSSSSIISVQPSIASVESLSVPLRTCNFLSLDRISNCVASCIMRHCHVRHLKTDLPTDKWRSHFKLGNEARQVDRSLGGGSSVRNVKDVSKADAFWASA